MRDDGFFGMVALMWVMMLVFNLALWGGLIWFGLWALNHFGVI